MKNLETLVVSRFFLFPNVKHTKNNSPEFDEIV